MQIFASNGEEEGEDRKERRGRREYGRWGRETRRDPSWTAAVTRISCL